MPPSDLRHGDDNPRMTLHDRIRARLTALEITPEAASRAAGMNKTYLRKLLERSGSVPGADTLAKLAEALQTTTEYLLRGDEASRPVEDLLPPPPNSTDVRTVEIAVPPATVMPLDLPVMGTAAGSHVGGSFQFEEGVAEYVRRPQALMGALRAYALYVDGTSMVPEHNPGDLRIVHPGRPPRIGDSVVVQIQLHKNAPIQATIGRLHRRTEKAVVITKLNPEATIELKLETVVAVHKVLTLNELFGV